MEVLPKWEEQTEAHTLAKATKAGNNGAQKESKKCVEKTSKAHDKNFHYIKSWKPPRGTAGSLSCCQTCDCCVTKKPLSLFREVLTILHTANHLAIQSLQSSALGSHVCSPSPQQGLHLNFQMWLHKGLHWATWVRNRWESMWLCQSFPPLLPTCFQWMFTGLGPLAAD